MSNFLRASGKLHKRHGANAERFRTMTLPNATPKTLGEIALSAAVKAVKADDSAAFTATVALSLLMANRQVERAETDKDITEKENKRTFRMFLKHYASKGGVVWRDTENMIAGIRAIGAGATSDKQRADAKKQRDAAISEYVDGGKNCTTQFAKQKDWRLVDGLAKLRTWSFRLMSDVCKNHAGEIRELLAKKAAGASGEALQEVFTDFVKRQYGGSFAQLTSSLAVDKPKEDKDAVESLFKRASELTDTELHLLLERLNAVVASRNATDSEMDGMFGDTAPEATPEPVLIPAEAETVAA